LTRFLVTGASGLLGLNLALKLAQEHDVTGVIHQPELEGTPFEVLVTDLSLPGEAEWVLEHCLPEVVIHCAAMAIVDESSIVMVPRARAMAMASGDAE